MWLAFALAGCSAECGGPACEDAWPASRLVVAHPAGLERDEALLTLPDRLEGALGDGAGWEVAARKAQLVIGMPERSAVVFSAAPVGIQPLADTTAMRLERPRTEEAGRAVALADTDGDGADELWVGAPGTDGDRGALLRYPPGAVDGDGFDGRWTGGSATDRFGERLFVCGDVTGDGREDLVVGAPMFTEPGLDVTSWPRSDVPVPRLAGAVFLLASEALVARPDAVYPWELGPAWWGSEAGAGVGVAVWCRDDLTGDGLADVLIGAPFMGADDEGRVYLRSAGSGLSSGPLTDVDPGTRFPDVESAGWFGASVVVAHFGGVDAIDAVPELVIGAPGWDGGRGRVLVLPIDDPGGDPLATITSPRALADHFGRVVQVGDIDGDGASDLLVGSPDWREQRGQLEGRTRYDAGHLWVWTGKERFRWGDGELDVLADLELRGTQPFLRIGRAVLAADLDGDGVDEILQPVRAPDPDER